MKDVVPAEKRLRKGFSVICAHAETLVGISWDPSRKLFGFNLGTSLGTGSSWRDRKQPRTGPTRIDCGTRAQNSQMLRSFGRVLADHRTWTTSLVWIGGFSWAEVGSPVTT